MASPLSEQQRKKKSGLATKTGLEWLRISHEVSASPAGYR